MNNDQQQPEDQVATSHEALERLAHFNRVLVEARMLPKNRPLTRLEIHDACAAFVGYCKEYKVAMARVAREVGLSQSVVSEWSKGRYQGDEERVTHLVNDWIERDSRRRQAKRPDDFVTTWVAETIRGIAYQADKRTMMAAIVAPAGAGKTKVLKALADEMRGVYLYCDADSKGRQFLISIAQAIGIPATGQVKAALKRSIIAELSRSHRILLLDEAHQLAHAVADVRSIHDQARVPVVMAGTADILTFVNDRSDGRGQFSSRCIQYNLMAEIRNAEAPDGGGVGKGRDLFTIEEIKDFFAMKKIRLANDALMLVWRLACLPNHGTLRLAEKVTEVAFDLNGELELVQRDYIVEALAVLHNANAKYLMKIADRANAAAADGAERKTA